MTDAARTVDREYASPPHENAPSSLPRAIGLKISVIARQSRQLFDERVEKLGVTRAKWVLIAAVAANPGATQRVIASQLEITDVTAGRLIDRVCADGLVERRANAQDRRAYCLYLTPAAQPVIEKMSQAAASYEDILFTDFDGDDLRTLDRLLDKLSSTLADLRRSGLDERTPSRAMASVGVE